MGLLSWAKLGWGDMENGCIGSDIKYIYLLQLRKNQNMSQVLPLFVHQNTTSVQSICAFWNTEHTPFSHSLAISHIPLVRQITYSEQTWDCAATPAFTVVPGPFLFSWILLVLPIMLRSLRTDEFLAFVCCINFNVFPLHLTAFFHNLHSNSRNYSLVLLPITTCAHSYILPLLPPPSKGFPS